MTKPAEKNGSDAGTAHDTLDAPAPGTPPRVRRPYAAPRLERKRAVERVTLLSGMGAMGVGVINMMN